MSTSYQSLIDQSIRATGGSGAGIANDAAYNAYSLTLNGLTNGNQYEVQVWINDSRANVAPAYDGLGTLDRGDGGPQVDYNVGNVVAGGGLGQYVIGTFTATGTSEVFTFDGYAAPTANVALLNAFQLRTIPEPTSALLGSLGLCGLFLRRRR